MNPVILYNNILNNDTLTATSTASGYHVDNLVDMRSYTKWKATSNGTQNIDVHASGSTFLGYQTGGTLRLISGGKLKLQFPAGVPPNAIGIYNHNLYSVGATVKVYYSHDGSSYTLLYTFVPASNNAQLKTFAGIAAAYWRVELSGMIAAPEIGILMLGIKLEFPWPPDSPVIPKREQLRLNAEYSDAGHLLGAVVAHFPIQIDHKWSRFARNWLDADFLPFWNNYGKQLCPFFYAWDLVNRPSDIYFVSVNPESIYQVPLTLLAYGDELQLSMRGVSE